MRAVAPLVLAMLALSASVPAEVLAQTPAVDPAATQILKRMTDYLGSLRQFSVRTQNTLEDLLDSEHRVDHEITASLLVSRPDKLHAERSETTRPASRGFVIASGGDSAMRKTMVLFTALGLGMAFLMAASSTALAQGDTSGKVTLESKSVAIGVEVSWSIAERSIRSRSRV
jgi:hypothetical protein